MIKVGLDAIFSASKSNLNCEKKTKDTKWISKTTHCKRFTLLYDDSDWLRTTGKLDVASNSKTVNRIRVNQKAREHTMRLVIELVVKSSLWSCRARKKVNVAVVRDHSAIRHAAYT